MSGVEAWLGRAGSVAFALRAAARDVRRCTCCSQSQGIRLNRTCVVASLHVSPREECGCGGGEGGSDLLMKSRGAAPSTEGSLENSGSASRLASGHSAGAHFFRSCRR